VRYRSIWLRKVLVKDKYEEGCPDLFGWDTIYFNLES
jgi:hypothetical protein